MHPLIEKIFLKKGIEDVTKLSADEKAIFDSWQATLSEREITPQVLESFLKEQKEFLWKELGKELQKDDYSKRRCLFLRGRIINYDAILGLLRSSKADKESLEKYLKQLLKT